MYAGTTLLQVYASLSLSYQNISSHFYLQSNACIANPSCHNHKSTFKTSVANTLPDSYWILYYIVKLGLFLQLLWDTQVQSKLFRTYQNPQPHIPKAWRAETRVNRTSHPIKHLIPTYSNTIPIHTKTEIPTFYANILRSLRQTARLW